MNSEIKAFALAEKYLKMADKDVGILGSGGFGHDKREAFFKEIKDLARLAKLASATLR